MRHNKENKMKGLEFYNEFFFIWIHSSTTSFLLLCDDPEHTPPPSQRRPQPPALFLWRHFNLAVYLFIYFWVCLYLFAGIYYKCFWWNDRSLIRFRQEFLWCHCFKYLLVRLKMLDHHKTIFIFFNRKCLPNKTSIRMLTSLKW